MKTTVASLCTARKQKVNRRIFQALECMYAEALQHMADSEGNITPADWEAFMIQILGEHLTGNLEFQSDEDLVATPQVLENYRRFDDRLRDCLHQKMKSLHHFERICVRT